MGELTKSKFLNKSYFAKKHIHEKVE